LLNQERDDPTDDDNETAVSTIILTPRSTPWPLFGILSSNLKC